MTSSNIIDLNQRWIKKPSPQRGRGWREAPGEGDFSTLPKKRILVMRYRFIGDTLLSVPFLRALRMLYPEARIEMLVAPQSGELLRDCPYIDELIFFDTTRKHRYENPNPSQQSSPPKSFWAYVLELRSRHYDTVFILKRSFSSALLAFLAGIPERIGFNTEGRRFLLTKALPYDSQAHEIDCFLSLLPSLQMHPPLYERTDLPSPQRGRRHAHNFLASQPSPLAGEGAPKGRMRGKKRIKIKDKIIRKYQKSPLTRRSAPPSPPRGEGIFSALDLCTYSSPLGGGEIKPTGLNKESITSEEEHRLEAWWGQAETDKARKVMEESYSGEVMTSHVVLHLSSSNALKQWPIESAQILLQWLLSHPHCHIHSLGSVSDQATYESLRSPLPVAQQNRFHIHCGLLTLLESMAFLKQMTFIVGVDSGTLHMAAAVGIPVVALFGPMNEHKWAPPTAHIVTEPVACRPCNLAIRCDFEDRCMTLLHPETVIERIKMLDLLQAV